ncbi:unnamed protein product [Dovyalis caffra]|uniref:Uncharacterized protein n=1 Tax=Dovyalis caffra TaxID=77055 RepID=A0AAV1RLX2_9ROSI|nr:unnamed protein product [Dovyalis caffra]
MEKSFKEKPNRTCESGEKNGGEGLSEGNLQVRMEKKKLEGEEEFSLPTEVLNKRADDFIARVNRQRMIEARLLVIYENVAGKVVLITGASSGVGEHLAYEYASRGAFLALVAGRARSLTEVAETARYIGSPDVIMITADVQRVEDCRRMVEETVNYFGRLDHLVNNAGINEVAMLEEMADITSFRTIMDTNFWGSAYTTRFAVPYLRNSGGKIVAISSSGSWLPTPRMSIYNASKAAMLSFFDTLRVELGSRVHVLVVATGFIESELNQGKNWMKESTMDVDQDLRDVQVSGFQVKTASGCAKDIVNSACRGDKYLTTPAWFHVTWVWKILCPDAIEWFYRLIYITRTDEPATEAPSKKVLDGTGAKKILYPAKRSINSEKVAGKVVLITGASSGIGEYLAYEYARRGACLALAARREERLSAVADKARLLGSPDVIVISADVSKVEDCERSCRLTTSHGVYATVDHLVNNAGIIQIDMFEDCKQIPDSETLMNTNFWGSVYVIRFAIPHLRKSKGRIVGISSIAGWCSVPKMSFYCASKAALISFYETLSAEFGSDIGITIVTPGVVESEMSQGDLVSKAKMDLIPAESTEMCAKAIVDSACRGDRYLIEPSWARITFLLKVLCPELLEWCFHWVLVAKTSKKRN